MMDLPTFCATNFTMIAYKAEWAYIDVFLII